MVGLFHPMSDIIVFTIFCHVVYDYYYVGIFVILVCTFIVEWRNSSIALLTCAIPELKSNIEAIDDSVLKGKVITNGGNRVFLIVFSFESGDE